MNVNFKRNLLISSALSMLILLVSSVASYMSITKLMQSNQLVNHTQEIIYTINDGAGVVVEAQNSVRGFLITGNSSLLSSYIGARKYSGELFVKVGDLTSDNRLQQKNIKILEIRRGLFFDYLESMVANKSAGQLATNEQLSNGKALLDDLKKSFKDIESEEKRLLQLRLTETENYNSYSLILIVLAACLALIISIIFLLRILRDYQQRIVLQQELEKSEKETKERIHAISNIAGQISQGNYEVRVEDSEGDALGSVAGSLNNMAISLQSSFLSLSEQEWLQAGIAQLNNVMLGEKNLETLTTDLMEFLSTYTNSNAGILYVVENEQLRAAGGYSYIPRKEKQKLELGEGLIGQSIISDRLLEIKTAFSDEIKINYALGEAKPAHIVAFPITESMIVGAIELASTQMYSDLVIEFFNTVGDNIGIAVKGAQNRRRLQELLEETQAQSEELRVQHTELESMNAELETQTEKLQASEEELKVQQEELQQTNEELAERSVLLEEQNTEIQKKSEALEVSTRYKSEFLANMSHELRTPLNSILLLSRLLSENNDENLNEEQIEFATVIQSSGNGLLGLIDEILDLSKIEAGKMDLEIVDLSIQEISSNMQGLFKEVAKSKGINFSIIDDQAPLVIKTDKMRLEQILKNLISNAIKFTSEGTVSLKIKNNPLDKKVISFVVKDSGIGIPKEQQPLIFEAFHQADGSTKRKYGGTGLGLSISRELSKLLKGEISIQSEVGKGSEFTLSIPISGTSVGQFVSTLPTFTATREEKSDPVAEDYDQFVSPIIPAEVPDDRENIVDGDKTILIVEDDTNFAKSLLEFTRKRGYKGIVAVRGDFALNMTLKFKPVGVLLDIQLPIKSGWEVMEELKANPQTKHIPVHIMSSHQLRQESLLKGAVNFLNKSVAFEQMPEIFKRIEHIINKDSQKVLIIEDNPKHAKALAFFLESNNINSEIKSQVSDGVDALQKKEVDCVILDMGVPDKQSYEILENVKKNPGLENLPIIVFTGKSLSMKEELKIKKYADSIVVKTAHSYQRMLDEVSLFLHLVEDTKTDDKRGNFKKLSLMNNILNGKTVLVVDDDVRNIYSLTKALEVLKMNVITAIDGKEALIALQQNPNTDVVLLDMMMPNMDGYETAQRIREDRKFKNLPVIAVTAKAMTGDREKCINAGASDYITKPVDVDQLLSLLRVWLYDKN